MVGGLIDNGAGLTRLVDRTAEGIGTGCLRDADPEEPLERECASIAVINQNKATKRSALGHSNALNKTTYLMKTLRPLPETDLDGSSNFDLNSIHSRPCLP